MPTDRLTRFVTARRTFLLTAAASASALAIRLWALPRPLSDEEIARIEARPVAGGVDDAVALDYDLSRSMPNVLAYELELGPVQMRWQRNFRINTVERDPLRGADRWSLSIEGLVDRPSILRWDELNAFGRTSVSAPFQCVEGWGLREVIWEGVPLARVLQQAAPRAGAKAVTFHTLGGVYTESLTLDQAMRPDVLLSDVRDGQPLPDNQGLPLRSVVPFMFGYKSTKWVNRIEVTATRHVGFWSRRGWPLDPYA